MVIVIQGINLVAVAIMGTLLTTMTVIGLRSDPAGNSVDDPPGTQEPREPFIAEPMVSTDAAHQTLLAYDTLDDWFAGRMKQN